MRRALLATLACGAIACGVKESPQQPEGGAKPTVAATTTTGEPTTSAGTSVETRTPAAVAPAPEAPSAPTPDALPRDGRVFDDAQLGAMERGVVPIALLGDPLMWVGSRVRSPLASLPRCRGAAPRDETCAVYGYGPVAVTRDGAAIYWPWTAEVGSCADGGALDGRRLALPGLDVVSSTPIIGEDGDPEEAAGKYWAWVGKLADAPDIELVAVEDLITALASQVSGIRSHDPLAVLGAPLEGWLVYAARTDGRVAVDLVSPDNARAHRLGDLAIVPGTCDPELLEAEGPCPAFDAPTILSVALTPDDEHLLVTMTLGDGSHCGVDKMVQRAWKLPEGITIKR